MSKVSVNRITNANIYVDGDNYLGKAEEVTLPMIKPIMSEHKALGLNAKIDLPSGIDKMEAKIKWNSLYADAQKKFANPYATIQLQVRANLEVYGSGGRSAQQAVVIFLTVQSKGAPLGSYKQHENVELENDLNVLYVKQTIDGVDTLEIDVLANIFKVGGVDVLAQFRQNLGV